MAGAGGIKAGKAFVMIGAIDKTGMVLKKVSARLNNFASGMQNIGRKMMAGFMGAAVPVALVTRVFVSYDDAMRRVGARSGATAEQMGALRKQVKYLGRTTSSTATQIANLQEILARRGFVPDEIIQATPHIRNLARAAGDGVNPMADIQNAATLTARAISSFRLKTSETVNIVDLFTVAANNSALSLTTLLNSLKYVGPIAKGGGLSLEQTVQTLGELADAGIEGSQAGTAMRKMLLQLAGAGGGKLEGMGITVAGEGGGFRPIKELIKEIEVATSGMEKLKKLEVFEEIFGTRAVSGAASLGMATDRLSKAIAGLGGDAKRTSDDMEKGLGGTFRRLWSAIEGIAIALGETLEGAMMGAGETITQIAGKVVAWIKANGELIVQIITTAAKIGLMGLEFIALSYIVGTFATVIGILSQIFTVAAVAARIFWFAVSGPIGLIILGITAIASAVMWLLGVFDDVGKMIGEIWDKVTFGLGDQFSAISGQIGSFKKLLSDVSAKPVEIRLKKVEEKKEARAMTVAEAKAQAGRARAKIIYAKEAVAETEATAKATEEAIGEAMTAGEFRERQIFKAYAARKGWGGSEEGMAIGEKDARHAAWEGAKVMPSGPQDELRIAEEKLSKEEQAAIAYAVGDRKARVSKADKAWAAADNAATNLASTQATVLQKEQAIANLEAKEIENEKVAIARKEAELKKVEAAEMAVMEKLRVQGEERVIESMMATAPEVKPLEAAPMLRGLEFGTVAAAEKAYANAQNQQANLMQNQLTVAEEGVIVLKKIESKESTWEGV